MAFSLISPLLKDSFDDPFAPGHPFEDPSIFEQLFDVPFVHSLYSRALWDDYEREVKFDGNVSLDKRGVEMNALQVVRFEGDASQDPTHEATTSESRSLLPDTSTEAKNTVYWTEDGRSMQRDAKQDTHSTMSEEDLPKTVLEDKVAEQNADQDIGYGTYEIEKAVGLTTNQELRLVAGSEAKRGAVREEEEGRTGVQATKNETDLSLAEDSDAGPTAQKNEPVIEKTSHRYPICSDSLAQTGNSLQEALVVELGVIQEHRAEASADRTNGGDEATVPEVIDGDSTAVEDSKVVFEDPNQRSGDCTPEMTQESNRKTDDDVTRSCHEVGDAKDKNLGIARERKKASPGTKDSPILVDEDTNPPKQPANEPIIIIDDDDEKTPRLSNKRKRTRILHHPAIRDGKEEAPLTKTSRKKRHTCDPVGEKVYHPSHRWRPKPYADDSDIESVYEPDWESEYEL